jgi:nucleoside-diphosphate-sugar epimerase
MHAEDRHDQIELCYANISDPLAMLTLAKGCDAVVHTAAFPTPHGRTHAEMLNNNVIGTQNVLDAAAANSASKVVLTSSIGALGFSFPKHPCLPDYIPIDISHPRRPQDIYGLTKVFNEESAASITRLHDLTTIVLRPPFVADLPTMASHGWLTRMAERKAENRETDLWGYIDCRDLAVYYAQALESSITGHHTFYTMADDLLCNISVVDLLRRHFPDREADIDRLTGNTFFDLTPTEAALAYKATHLWRNYV